MEVQLSLAWCTVFAFVVFPRCGVRAFGLFGLSLVCCSRLCGLSSVWSLKTPAPELLKCNLVDGPQKLK